MMRLENNRCTDRAREGNRKVKRVLVSSQLSGHTNAAQRM